MTHVWVSGQKGFIPAIEWRMQMAKAKKTKVTRAKKAEGSSVVDAKYRENYTVHDIKTASGKRRAVDVDDKVAKMLRGQDMAGLRKIAREHKLLDRFDEKWANLNPGLARMAMGNALRGALSPKAKKKAA